MIYRAAEAFLCRTAQRGWWMRNEASRRGVAEGGRGQDGSKQKNLIARGGGVFRAASPALQARARALQVSARADRAAPVAAAPPAAEERARSVNVNAWRKKRNLRE